MSHSQHPSHGYPFAITGINITHLVYNLLLDGDLKTHFFNERQSTLNIDDFHNVYCKCFLILVVLIARSPGYVFCEFDKLWLNMRPKDIMEFRFAKQTLTQQLKEQLTTDLSTAFTFTPPVQTI